MHFCKIENFTYGEINERSFSNPHPRRCWMEIIDAGWKQNIANKYCETLNVNSLHINIFCHKLVKLAKSCLLGFTGTIN